MWEIKNDVCYMSYKTAGVPHDDRLCSHRFHLAFLCYPHSFATFKTTTYKYNQRDSDQRHEREVYEFLRYKSASMHTKFYIK